MDRARIRSAMTGRALRAVLIALPTALGAKLAAIPLIPDGDGARELAEKELAKPEYQAAKPTLIDQWARAVIDWLADLFTPQHAVDLGPWAAIVIGAVLVAALIAVLLIWGRPRRSRSRSAGSVLLGSADDRTAASRRRRARGAGTRTGPRRSCCATAPSRDPSSNATSSPRPRSDRADDRPRGRGAVPRRGRGAAHRRGGLRRRRYLGHPGTSAQYRALAEIDDRLRALRRRRCPRRCPHEQHRYPHAHPAPPAPTADPAPSSADDARPASTLVRAPRRVRRILGWSGCALVLVSPPRGCC
jgi:hypothetical protein